MAFWKHIYQPTHRRRRSRPLPAAHGQMQINTTPDRPAGKRRGVALLMVLVITTVMSAIATDLKNSSQVNLQAAANARDELQAHFHARSAIELELFVLRFQGMIKQTLGQFLPIPLFELSGFLVSSDTVKGIVNRERTPSDDPPPESVALNQPFGNFHGSFWIEDVIDENRKINLNQNFGLRCQNFLPLLMAAVFDDPRYDPLFEGLGDTRDPLRNRLELIGNVVDWIDGDEVVDNLCILTQDESVASQPEDNRYNHLPYEANYKPKNGMMNSLAELRMVPTVNDAFMRLFAKYFTVWGDNPGISMKTADDFMIWAVIRAISPPGPVLPGDREKFQRFLTERALMLALPGAKLDENTFKVLLSQAEIPFVGARLQELVSKKFISFDDISSVYRITAIGRVNDASSRITLVWRGFGTTGELYYWREE